MIQKCGGLWVAGPITVASKIPIRANGTPLSEEPVGNLEQEQWTGP